MDLDEGDQIREFNENDVVEIRHGYTSLFKGFLRLNIGKRGSAEKVDKEIGEVNEKNNISATRHERFTYWSSPTRRPYRRRRRSKEEASINRVRRRKAVNCVC